jgi:hypothetical protein
LPFPANPEAAHLCFRGRRLATIGARPVFRAGYRDRRSRQIDRLCIDCAPVFRHFGRDVGGWNLSVLMKRMAVFGGACSALCGAALGQDGTAAQESRPVSRPVVVEMFLSQACKSSPPASAYLTELSARPDVVALAWHVDYWDKVAARNVGAWVDPFARTDFAERQKTYNERIRGRAMVFTPQAVIDGFISVVGSKRETVEARILDAQVFDEKARATPPRLLIEALGRDKFRTRIDDVGAPYDALLVQFRRAATTEVGGGDNAGVTFRETNVVRAVSSLVRDHTGPGDFSFNAPGDGLDCAVLVQERNNGRIVAARYCSDRTAD